MRRPVLSLVVFTALLLALAAPAVGLKLGASGVSTLPNRLESKRGFDAIARDFPQASTNPALIARQRPTLGAGRDPEAAPRPGPGPRLRPGSDLRYSTDGRVAAIGVLVAGDETGPQALNAVRHLRSTTIPHDFAGAGARVLVGGDTAQNVDYIDSMNAWLPRVVLFVLGLSLVLLTIVFRSLVIAALSIALNLLSVAAAYGLVILVFLHGVGSGLLGFQQVHAIDAWVPLFLFSVLFGLSMDYQVFLLSRIKERYDQTGSTNEAVDPRRRLDGAADHRRGADHRRRLQRLRDGRPRHVPADGLRDRRRAADRRDDHPLGAAARGDAPAGRVELVPAGLARVAAADRGRGRVDGGAAPARASAS